MALDMYVRDPRQIVFIQNVADWLVQAEDLISIRSKELPLRPLKNIGDMGRNLVKWANMVGPSVLVIIMGIALWRGRAIRKKATLSQYEEGRKTDEE